VPENPEDLRIKRLLDEIDLIDPCLGSRRLLTVLQCDLGVKISKDERGRWMDNVFIERLWRNVKCEEIELFEHATVPVLRTGLRKWSDRQPSHRMTPSMIH
jgi:hypothetical protein